MQILSLSQNGYVKRWLPPHVAASVLCVALAIQGAAARGQSLESVFPLEVESVSGPAWERHTIDDTSAGADGVKLGDFDGDGRLDIVTGWEEGGEVRVYRNPGPVQARDPWPRVTVGNVASPEDAVFADLDADGRLEVVSCTEGETRTVYWHQFRGESVEWSLPERWSTTAIPALSQTLQWMQALPMDLDGEHGSDLILGAKGAGAVIGWMRAAPPRDHGVWRFEKIREAGWIMSLLSHDVDGDGDLDVVFTDRKGPRSGVFWLENSGAEANRAQAAWREHAIGALGREVMFASLGDVDRDGRVDVLAAVKPREIACFLRLPDGGWREQILHLDGKDLGNAKAIEIADLSGDSLPDVVFSCEGARGELEGVVWLERQQEGPWHLRPLGGPAGVKFDLMEALDLDGDGDLDVLTCEEGEGLGVVWYENPTR